jgi:hypothetical protein
MAAKRITVASLANDVAALTEVVGSLVEAMGSTEAPAKPSRRGKSKDIVAVGSEFDYTNGNGETTRHIVVEVKGRGENRRAFTDQDQRFKLTTLAKRNGENVTIL